MLWKCFAWHRNAGEWGKTMALHILDLAYSRSYACKHLTVSPILQNPRSSRKRMRSSEKFNRFELAMTWIAKLPHIHTILIKITITITIKHYTHEFFITEIEWKVNGITLIDTVKIDIHGFAYEKYDKRKWLFSPSNFWRSRSFVCTFLLHCRSSTRVWRGYFLGFIIQHCTSAYNRWC